jgi:hypothetical protein
MRFFRTTDGQLMNLDQIVAIKPNHSEGEETYFIILLPSGHGVVMSEEDANRMMMFITVVNEEKQ